MSTGGPPQDNLTSALTCSFETVPAHEPISWPPRALALLPVAFLCAAVLHYARIDRLPSLLWLCNVANLVLALAIFARARFWMWLAAIWLAVGVPLWVWDMFVERQFFLHSFLTHIGSASLALYCVRGTAPHPWLWSVALSLGLVLQTLCHFITPAHLNINVSHAPYQGFSGFFERYPVYLIVHALGLGAILFALQRGLSKLAR